MSSSFRRIAVVVTALALAATACGNSSNEAGTTTSSTPAEAPSGGGEATRNEFVPISGVPGVTDDEISYAVIGTKTGNPLGNCILDCYVDGIEAYFAYRNSEGGIYGRDLVVGEVIDDELAMNQQKSLEVISSADVFGVFQATLLATGWGDLDQAGIPTYTWGIHSTEAANRPSIFPSLAVPCPDCVRPAVPYLASTVGATKAASIGYGVSENSKVCTKAVADAFTKYQDQSGVEVVYTKDDLDYGLANGIGPEVTAMKEAGVDFISTCIDLNGMKTLAQELSRQGMDDVVLFHPNSYDQGFIAESDGLFEGDIVSVQYRPLESTATGSGLAEFNKWMAQQNSAPTELAMVGWINAATAFDSLLAAGPDFDRASVIAAMNAITDYSADGLLEPVDWTTAHTPYTVDQQLERDGSEVCGAYVKIVGGKFEPVAGADTPWYCWDGRDPAAFQPTPRNFG